MKCCYFDTQDNTKEKEAVKRADAAEYKLRTAEEKLRKIQALCSNAVENTVEVSCPPCVRLYQFTVLGQFLFVCLHEAILDNMKQYEILFIQLFFS